MPTNQKIVREKAIENLEKSLPEIFARKQITHLLGGAIAPGTLANLGKNGPPFFMVGRNAVYEKESFLEWFKGYVNAE